MDNSFIRSFLNNITANDDELLTNFRANFGGHSFVETVARTDNTGITATLFNLFIFIFGKKRGGNTLGVSGKQ